MAIVSTNHYLTIYSVETQRRVFHKRIPSSTSESSDISSVQFCEANILVGRASNTILDLIQITNNISVIGTIILSNSSNQVTVRAIFDYSNSALWLSANEKLFGLHYNLKGQPPVKSGEEAIPWSKAVQVGLDAEVLSVALGKDTEGEGSEIIFAHPKGIMLGLIGKEICQILTSPVHSSSVQKLDVEKRDKVEEVPVVDEEGVSEVEEELNVEEEQTVQGSENENGDVEPIVPEIEKEKVAEEEVQVKEEPKTSNVVYKAPSPSPTPSLPSLPAPGSEPTQAVSQTEPTREVESSSRMDIDDDEPVIIEKNSEKALSEENTRQLKKVN